MLSKGAYLLRTNLLAHLTRARARRINDDGLTDFVLANYRNSQGDEKEKNSAICLPGTASRR